MRAARLPFDPGTSGWEAILPSRTPRPALAGHRTADWLVIGAGFAGLAAARRLSELDPKGTVVLLEARRVGEGPAGRNSGFMIDLPHDLASDDYGGALARDREQIRWNRLAIDFARQMAREFGLSDEVWSETGKVNGAATAKGERHNHDYAAHLDALGEAHEGLDATAMRSLTGTGYYRSGLYTPGTVMLQPAAYVRAVADGIVSNRVVLHEGSPVMALEKEGATWRATTPAGSVSAPSVILAVNGHATSFGLFRRRLMPVFTYASMTRALTDAEVRRLGGEQRWNLTPADPMGTTVRRVSDAGGERIVVRNRFTYNPSMAPGEGLLARVYRDHDHAFDARFPMLAEVAMEHRWGGMLSLSRNGAAAFGEVRPGLFAACCQNGLGTVRGTLSGMLAAELATRPSRPSEALTAQLAAEGPSRLPPAPAAWLGANGLIRWKERRAGAEL